MKRIATIAAVVTAFAVAPSWAAGANVATTAQPRVTAEVVGVQVAQVRVAHTARVQTAVSVQRHLVQMRVAMRFAQLRALLR